MQVLLRKVGPIAAVAVVTDDVRRVPVPNPLRFELSQRSQGFLPRLPSFPFAKRDPQGFADQLKLVCLRLVKKLQECHQKSQKGEPEA
jgi:hypothetical protein